MKKLSASLLFIFSSASVFADASHTEAYFNTIKSNPEQLTYFLYSMPKGGDLHSHMGGANYAEDMLRYANNDGLCLDRKSNIASKNSACENKNLLIHTNHDKDLKKSVVDAWSMQDFDGTTGETGHDHFFNTFEKFGTIETNHPGEILAEIVERAGLQNENYLELMDTFNEDAIAQLGMKIKWNPDFNAMRTVLLNGGMHKITQDISKILTDNEASKNQILMCKSAYPKAGCDIKVHYLYQILREQEPERVFTQLLAGFEAAKHDARIVGINMVQPEDGKISMRDYALHMKMVGYLHKLYPNVKISLHAGELNEVLAPADGLKFHIHDAVYVAHANRIGHGVDIIHETDYQKLLDDMAKNHILVEINLTSNDKILNITGDNHPLPLYLLNNVPVAISTDDEGVNRSNMTKEYSRAVTSYQLSYPVLKNIARNSIYYSFLPGKNLWKSDNYKFAVDACKNDALGVKTLSNTCKQFLAQNEKAKTQWDLERRFSVFESMH